MNTSNIYISKLSVVTTEPNTSNGNVVLTFKNYRNVIVRKYNFRPGVFFDLKRKGVYYSDMAPSYSLGTKCLNPNETRSFNNAVGNKKKHLSKKKVLKMYDEWEKRTNY